jgi:hypothetical protein
MLVVVVLLPLSSPVYDGEFDHGGGRGGCGGQTAAAVAAVAAVEANLSAKAAGNKSVDGRMMACDDEIGWRTTTQQPTNEQRRGSGGGGSATVRGWRQLGESGRRRRRGGGSSATAQRWRQLGGSAAAAAHSATVAARWQQRGGCGGGCSNKQCLVVVLFHAKSFGQMECMVTACVEGEPVRWRIRQQQEILLFGPKW